MAIYDGIYQAIKAILFGRAKAQAIILDPSLEFTFELKKTLYILRPIREMSPSELSTIIGVKVLTKETLPIGAIALDLERKLTDQEKLDTESKFPGYKFVDLEVIDNGTT